MHGLKHPAALRVGQGKPKIVFLTTKEAGINALAVSLERRMAAFTVEVHDPFARIEGSDEAVDLVLMRPVAESDVTTYIVAGRRHYPNAAIGLLVDHGLPAGCMELLQTGLIKGVVPLDLDVGVLSAVLGILVAGGEYCPPDLVLRFPNPLPAPERNQAPNYAAHRLTPRETQIMSLLSEGLQNKLIAAQMGLSEHTVKAHVRNLFAKLRVSNRTQAVAKCRQWIGDAPRYRGEETIPGSGTGLGLFVG